MQLGASTSGWETTKVAAQLGSTACNWVHLKVGGEQQGAAQLGSTACNWVRLQMGAEQLSAAQLGSTACNWVLLHLGAANKNLYFFPMRRQF
jgi:hypothetical protein